MKICGMSDNVEIKTPIGTTQETILKIGNLKKPIGSGFEHVPYIETSSGLIAIADIINIKKL